MFELPDIIHREIKSLCERGDELAESGNDTEAVKLYERAWQLLPEPREQWEAATWILVAIGDVQFLSHRFTAAHEAFVAAMSCPEAFGNPFVHLRLGQTYFEIGDADTSADELTRAFALEGAHVFEREDPKYFAFLKTRIRAPLAGWESMYEARHERVGTMRFSVPTEPLAGVVADAIRQVIEQVAEISEAYLPACLMHHEAEPRQVLLIGISPSAAQEKVVDELLRRLRLLLPPGRFMDVLPFPSGGIPPEARLVPLFFRSREQRPWWRFW